MNLLLGKKILITGIASNRSIAYGIAKSCHQQGANLAFTYADDRLKSRVQKLAEDFESSIVLPCNVTSDFEIDKTFSELGKHWNKLDGLVHAIAFVPKEAISGNLLDGLTRETFRIAHDVSAYSFPAISKAAIPLIEEFGASILTLSYLGSSRVIPNYNVMGMAKASLESGVRYLAENLGAIGVRVNAISAGPIKTLAASGIKDFQKVLKFVRDNSPLKKNITSKDIGDAAVFLLSNLSGGITGEVIHVDAGFSIGIGGMNNISTKN